MKNTSTKGNKRFHERGSTAILISLMVSVLILAAGTGNLLWTRLFRKTAIRQSQASSATIMNKDSIELVAKLFKEGTLVAFTLPAVVSLITPSPLPKVCNPGYKLDVSGNCIVDNAQAGEQNQPPPPGIHPGEVLVPAHTETVCTTPKCNASCDSPCTLQSGKGPDVCIPPPEVCKEVLIPATTITVEGPLCVPLPDGSNTVCTPVEGSGKPELTPPPSPVPLAGVDESLLSQFDSNGKYFITFNPQKSPWIKDLDKDDSGKTALKPDYLSKAFIKRRLINPRKFTSTEKSSEEELSSGTPIDKVSCSDNPGNCLDQFTRFGNVDPGKTIELLATTNLNQFSGKTSEVPVVTRAKVPAPSAGQAPIPTCSLTATPTNVLSYSDWAGQMWTQLTVNTQVSPDFPGLVSYVQVGDNKIESTTGTFTVPYPYGQSSWTYQAVVAGPGGSSLCETTVTSSCVQRSPVCIPGKCWYPIDNFPRCKAWLVCPNGQGCWNRGEILGCFHPSTRVRLETGKWKRVSEILAGESLWNPVLKKGVRVKELVVGPEPLPLIEIKLKGNRIKVTRLHPVMTSMGLRRAEALKVGDQVITSDGTSRNILSIKKQIRPAKATQIVYNFTMDVSGGSDDEHYLEAEGMVVGDHYLQEKLARE